MQMRIGRKPNKIQFVCENPDLDYFDKPVPASKVIPKWYKETDSYTDKPMRYTTMGISSTIKKCMPVFDVMSSGYIITLPCDVHVGLDALGLPSFTWTIEYNLVTDHDLSQVYLLPFPQEMHTKVFKWSNPWIVRTPKGWSTMFVAPNYSDDSPFKILPAIVDTDGFELSVQFPFLLRKGFEGVIKAGTPIAQVIPFKRASWEASYSTLATGLSFKNLQKHSRFFSNRYKRTFWNRKDYK